MQTREHLEAELQNLCDVIHPGDKDRKAHILFITLRPIANGPLITYNCTKLSMTVGEDVVQFRTCFWGGYMDFTAKMVRLLKKTMTNDNEPAHYLSLGSSEAWQNA